MKWLGRIAVGLLLILVLIVAGVIFYGGTLIQQGVEKVGPMITKVDVTLDKALFYPLRGYAGLKGLTVGNPEGFETDHLMSVGGISVKVDKGSLRTDTIVIREILIENPDINYEMTLKGTNLKAFLEGMEGDDEAREDAVEPEAEDLADAESSGKKVVIESLKVLDGKVHISSKTLLGLGAPIPLPDIELTDIGKEAEDDGGTTIPEVIAMVLKEIAGSVTQVATGAINLAGKGVDMAADTAVAGAKLAGNAALEGAELAGDAAQAAGAGAMAVGKGAVNAGAAVGGGAVDAGKAVGAGLGKVVGGAGGLLGIGKDEADEGGPEK